MNARDIANGIRIVDGRWSLDSSTFPGSGFDRFAGTFTANGPLPVNDASVSEQANQVVVAGTISLLGTEQLPASFVLTPAGTAPAIQITFPVQPNTMAMHLSTFTSTFLPELPLPPGLVIGRLTLTLYPGGAMNFEAEMAWDSLWTIEVLGVPVGVGDLRMSGGRPVDGAGDGGFSGKVVTGAFDILGLRAGNVGLHAAPDGLTFRVTEQTSPAVLAMLSGTISRSDSSQINAHGSVFMGFDTRLDFDFGSISSFRQRVALDVEVHIRGGSAAVSLAGDIVFAGMRVHVPAFSPVPRADLFASLEQEIRDAVNKAFDRYFVSSPQSWADLVRNGTISLGNSVVRAAGMIAMLGLDLIRNMDLLQKVSTDPVQIATALWYSQGKSAADIVAALGACRDPRYDERAIAATARALGWFGAGVDGIALALRDRLGMALNDVARVIWDAGTPLALIYDGFQRAFGSTLHPEVVPWAIAQALQQDVNLDGRAVARLMRGAMPPEQVALGIEALYKLTPNELGSVLSDAGFGPGEIVKQLGAFGWDATQAAGVLAFLGQSKETVARILHDAGYAEEAVETALEEKFGIPYEGAKEIWDNLF